jgi:hypothetical protein
MKKGSKDKERRVPNGVDVSDLQFLEYGDMAIVAQEVGMDTQYVRRVKNLKSYNVKILAALLKRGAQNRKILTEAK